MNKKAYLILRIGLAITFIVIGLMIIQAPEAWGTFLKPWAADLIPVSIKTAMLATGILDLLIGLFLLVNIFTWLAALVGAIHLVIVLVTTGITMVTVRDIGLLAATLFIAIQTSPYSQKI